MNHRLDQLELAETRRCEAMLSDDVEALDGLLDLRLHFSHANGAVDDKARYVAKLQAGRIVYLSIDWSERAIIDLGSTAVITGRMSSRVMVDEVEKCLHNRVMAVWGWSEGWRLVAFQSTPLSPA